MRNSAKWVAKLLVTAAILAAIVWKFDPRTLVSELAGLSLYGVLAAILLTTFQMLCSAARLSLIVSLYQRRLPLGESFCITLESLFFAQTFISFLGSDSLRIWRIRRYGAPLSEAVSAITLDRLIGIIVNHICLLAGLPFAFATITDPSVRIGLSALALAGVAGVVVVMMLGMLRGRTGLSEKLMLRFRSRAIVPMLLEIATVGRHLLAPRVELLEAALLSLVIAILNSMIFFVILYAWGVSAVTALKCAVLIPGVLEIAMLPISVAGWGVREGIVIFTFGKLGVPATLALGSSLVYALILLGLGMVGGAIWLVDPQARSAREPTVADRDAAAPAKPLDSP